MRDSKSLMFCFQMLAAAMRQTKVRLTAHDLRLKTSIGTVSVNRVRGLWNSSCSATNHSSKVNIMAENLLTTSNPVFQAYLYYCCILGLKMLAMSFLTARQRIRKGILANPEDVALNPKKSVIKFDDIDVERVRRAHHNDLENIPIFIIIALVYVMTNPSKGVAINLFRIFTAGRIIHTMVYAVFVVPQPARFLAFFVSYLITIYMAVIGLLSFTF